jgi:alpha-L-rhamnosidase
MLGQIMEWSYHGLTGIGGDLTGPGFKRIIIRPQPVGDLTWVKASFDSFRGKISSQWTKADGVFNLSVSISPNTTATVFVPARPGDQVSLDGVTAGRDWDAKSLRQEKDRAVFGVGSGQRVFQSRL